MNLPGAPTIYHSVGALASYLRSLATAIAAGWNIEHRVDGKHKLPWVDVAYSAADFTADTGTWTADPANGVDLTFRYWLVDHTMTVALNAFGTTLSSTPVVLTLRVPGGRMVKKSHRVAWVLNDNGTYRLGMAQAVRNTSTIQIQIAGLLVAFAAGTTGVHGTITFEVDPL